MLAIAAILIAVLVGWLVAQRFARGAKRAIDDRRKQQREAGLRSQVSEKAAKSLGLREPADGDYAFDDGHTLRLDPSHGTPASGTDGASSGAPNVVDLELAVAPSDEAMQALFREVDVYIAYGRFDDAAVRLKRAMEESPNQYELRAKLGEIHFEAGDAEAFTELARSLYLRLQENGDEGLWGRIALLGQRLAPEERLFQQTLTAPVAVPEPDYDGVDELARRRTRRI